MRREMACRKRGHSLAFAALLSLAALFGRSAARGSSPLPAVIPAAPFGSVPLGYQDVAAIGGPAVWVSQDLMQELQRGAEKVLASASLMGDGNPLPLTTIISALTNTVSNAREVSQQLKTASCLVDVGFKDACLQSLGKDCR